ncbi:MAG: PfkB family carbohydrate kinase [Candidatus Omnitrophota bacterium]
MSLVVLGTVALDSLKTPCGEKKDLLGGSAAHFSMSASHFTQVHLAAVIGEDFPKKHIQFLKNKGIITKSLAAQKGKTFRWCGEYKKDDLNVAHTKTTELGVIAECFPSLHKTQKNIKNVFLGNYAPDVQLKFLKELNNPEFIGLDTMNLWIHNMRQDVLKLLKKADILIINDAETKALSREDNLLKAAKHLNSLGPKMVIVKKGEHGCLFYSKKYVFNLPAFPIEKVVDPTGAGDTFAGGVMGYLAKSPKINENILKRAIAYGTIFSSFNVSGFGMKCTGLLKKSQVENRLKVYKNFFKF